MLQSPLNQSDVNTDNTGTTRIGRELSKDLFLLTLVKEECQIIVLRVKTAKVTEKFKTNGLVAGLHFKLSFTMSDFLLGKE